MFGLSRQERRWKAEQQAAELLVSLAALALQESASVRVAEINAEIESNDRISKLQDEIEDLRMQLAFMSQKK